MSNLRQKNLAGITEAKADWRPHPAEKRHDPDNRLSPACSLPDSRNPMPDTPKVTGPASYFPSIEKTYGETIKHWMDILQKAGSRKHMELVALLKSQHAIGHGHANALVAVFLAK